MSKTESPSNAPARRLASAVAVRPTASAYARPVREPNAETRKLIDRALKDKGARR